MANRLRPAVNWRDHITNNKSWHDDMYIKVYDSEDLRAELVCSSCRRHLSVPPFYYNNVNMYRTCGRCYNPRLDKKKDSQYECGMVQDHLYMDLISYLIFECSNESCEEKLFWHEVEDHEDICTHKPPVKQEYKQHSTRVLTTDLSLTLTNVARKLLTCDECKKPLSVLPIISFGRRFVCGRCTIEPESGDVAEQKIFAIMSQFILFPCANKGCPEVLPSDGVIEHERTCRWATMECPFCGRDHKVLEMSLHIRSQHLYQTNGNDDIEIKPQTVLYEVERTPYIVSVKKVDGQQQSYAVSVYGLDEKDYDHLRVELIDEDNENVLENHLVGVERLKHTDESKDAVQFRSSGKKAFLRLDTVKWTGGLVCVHGLALDKEVSDQLRCNVCSQYMTAKIYNCENKHPICCGCKARVERCPTCRGKLEGDRDLELKIEASLIRFPCPFEESNGCDLALTPKFLSRHKIRCQPRDIVMDLVECPFRGCGEENYRLTDYERFVEHCAQDHYSSVVHQGNEEEVIWSTNNHRDTNRFSRVLFFDGEVFIVLYRLGGGTKNSAGNFDETQGFSFCVVQKNASTKRYNYTLELISNGLIVERKGRCGVRPSTLGVDVLVELEVVKGMLTLQDIYPDQSSVLTYRVKLEEDETYEFVDKDNEAEADDSEADSDDDDFYI